MAEDPPNNPNPNIQKPSIPPNNKQKDKGLTELSKKIEDLKKAIHHIQFEIQKTINNINK